MVSSISAFGAESTQTGIHHHYQAPRPLGMGDAFVAVANDYSTLFYNPAGLARLENGQINASMDFSGSSSIVKFAKDVSDLGSATYADDNAKYQAFGNFLQDKYGSHYSGRFGLFEGMWVRPNWGIAVLPMDMTVEMEIHNQGAPAIDYRAYLDTTLAYGYGADIKGVPGRLSWGTTVKFVNRGYSAKQFTALDLVADSNLFKKEDLREGYTVDVDLGMLYTPDLPAEGIFSMLRLAKPTFGAVIRNVADYGFGSSLKLINKTPGQAPEKLYRVIDIGTKWEYPSLWIFGGRGVLDIRDIMHPYFNTRRALHLGFEFDWSVASWWKGQYRVGLNQGYLTGGLSALFTVFRLDLVTYGEDVGYYNAPKENRIYMAKFNIDI
ncbi:MAG: hypothetical protein BroJett040_22090 [Oligoflexia bacterium]|nr:MAG: hypothetical protein BroJett040_22090 [Oligoflexia bacterium]